MCVCSAAFSKRDTRRDESTEHRALAAARPILMLMHSLIRTPSTSPSPLLSFPHCRSLALDCLLRLLLLALLLCSVLNSCTVLYTCTWALVLAAFRLFAWHLHCAFCAGRPQSASPAPPSPMFLCFALLCFITRTSRARMPLIASRHVASSEAMHRFFSCVPLVETCA